MALLESDPQDVEIADDGDIRLDEEGLHFVAGIAAVVQAIKFRVQLFAKEWFLNQDIGIPYYEELLGDASKIPGVLDRARAVFGAAILDAPGVTQILNLSVTIDTVERIMTITAQARCIFGDTPVVEITV